MESIATCATCPSCGGWLEPVCFPSLCKPAACTCSCVVVESCAVRRVCVCFGVCSVEHRGPPAGHRKKAESLLSKSIVVSGTLRTRPAPFVATPPPPTRNSFHTQCGYAHSRFQSRLPSVRTHPHLSPLPRSLPLLATHFAPRLTHCSVQNQTSP